MISTKTWLAAVAALWLATTAGYAQTRPSYLDRPAEVLVPSDQGAGGTHPLYVFLPYTGGTASEFFRKMRSIVAADSPIVLLPQGRPRTSDYLPDFVSFVEWYEERLVADIRSAIRSYAVDVDRIAVVGHSLGGDLAWALVMRNPQLFRGAVLAGTRASYPKSSSALDVLVDRGFRAAFIIGENESPARSTGIARAEAALEEAGIETRFRVVPGGGHTYGTPRECIGDLRWTLGGREPADSAAAGRRSAAAAPGPTADSPRTTAAAGGVVFPHAGAPVWIELPGSWSPIRKSRRGIYTGIYDAERDSLRIRMYVAADESIDPAEHLALFADSLPFTRDVRFYSAQQYFGDLRPKRDWPVATGVTESRWFLARAAESDGTSILVVVSTPERSKNEHQEAMRELLR